MNGGWALPTVHQRRLNSRECRSRVRSRTYRVAYIPLIFFVPVVHAFKRIIGSRDQVLVNFLIVKLDAGAEECPIQVNKLLDAEFRVIYVVELVPAGAIVVVTSS